MSKWDVNVPLPVLCVREKECVKRKHPQLFTLKMRLSLKLIIANEHKAATRKGNVWHDGRQQAYDGTHVGHLFVHARAAPTRLWPGGTE